MPDSEETSASDSEETSGTVAPAHPAIPSEESTEIPSTEGVSILPGILLSLAIVILFIILRPSKRNRENPRGEDSTITPQPNGAPQEVVPLNLLQAFLKENSSHPVTKYYCSESLDRDSQVDQPIDVGILADAEVKFGSEALDSWLNQLIAFDDTYQPAVVELGERFTEKRMLHRGSLEDPREARVTKILHRGLALKEQDQVILKALVKATH